MRSAFLPFLMLVAVLGLSCPAAQAQEPVPAAKTTEKPAVAQMPGTPWVPEYGGAAHVMRRDNTDIYIMSRPDRPFVVTGRLVNDYMSVMTDPESGLVVMRPETILEMVDALLAKARRQQIYYDFPYDALLTTDGQVGTFVRWKNRQPAAPATPTTPDTSSARK